MKRYKLRMQNRGLFLLRWVSEGKLFGPYWEEIGRFDINPGNIARCKEIVNKLNECDTHTNKSDND